MRNGKTSQVRVFLPCVQSSQNLFVHETYFFVICIKISSNNCFKEYNLGNTGLVCRCPGAFNLEEEAIVV